MSVIEKLAIISDTITKVMNFVISDELVKPDFEEYLATISAKNADSSKMQAYHSPQATWSPPRGRRSFPFVIARMVVFPKKNAKLPSG